MATNWKKKLARTLRVRNDIGEVINLKTLADAREYFVALPADSTQSEPWRRFAELIFQAAAGGDPEAVTLQLETLLLHRGKLVLH